jgi:hypothetical protein
MVPCRSCNKDISEEAAKCPLCGCKLPTHRSWVSAKLNRIGLAFVATLLGVFLLYVGVTGDNNWVPAIGSVLAVGGLGLFLSGSISFAWTSMRGNWQSAASR